MEKITFMGMNAISKDVEIALFLKNPTYKDIKKL